jgi:hypothetical protein
VADGIRKLTLHYARRSWATWALQAGKNIKWVADQLGHADPSTTLKHYAHAMPEDDTDLSFLDLNVTKRHQRLRGFSVSGLMARREGFEPPWSLRSHSLFAHRSQLPLRFEV